MTSSARPNLSGLFNGSTPPQRPSRIADPVSPRLVVPPPVQEPPADSGQLSGPSAEQAPAFASWADPVALVNQYFQFLRTVLDVNQQFAVAAVTAVTSLPRRVGLRR
ncbi:MAG: hypothetical protein ABWZ02_01635 [Nakamurella sp.]